MRNGRHLPTNKPIIARSKDKISPSSRASMIQFTSCKQCRRFILPGVKAVWLTNPIGLSHRECPS